MGAAGDPAVGVLHVVEAVVVGFPDLDAGARDGVAVGVGDGALDPAGLAGGAAGDVPAHARSPGRPRRRTARRRWPRWRCRGFVVDRDGLHGGAEDVGEQDELLALVVGDVPGVGEEPDRGVPFVLGQPDLADEGVQVPGQGLHQLPSAAGPGPARRRRGRVSVSCSSTRALLGADPVDGGVGHGRSLGQAGPVPVGQGPGSSPAGRCEQAGEVLGGHGRGLRGGDDGQDRRSTASGMSSSVNP